MNNNTINNAINQSDDYLADHDYHKVFNQVYDQVLLDIKSSQDVAAAFEEDEKSTIQWYRDNQASAEYANELISCLYDDYCKDLAFDNTPPEFRPTALNTARAKLSEMDNLSNWQLVFCSRTEIRDLIKINPKKAKIIDGFYFVDTYTFSDFALSHTLDSVIRLDVAVWAFDQIPNLVKRLKDKGALFSKRFDIEDKFWFIPSSYKDCLDEFHEFSNDFIENYLDELQTAEDSKICKEVEPIGYLATGTASMYFGKNWNAFPKSTLAVYNHLVMMSKGKFYSKHGFLNLSNNQIAEAIGYSPRSVTRAIGILSKEETYVTEEEITKPITREEQEKHGVTVLTDAIKQERIKTSRRKGGLGLITTTMDNNKDNQRERRIVIHDLEDVVNKELQIPTFKMEGLGRTAALFASLVTYANALNISVHKHSLKREHLQMIGAKLGLSKSYLRKIIRDLIKSKILVIVDKVIYFTQDYINQYYSVYRGYINHLMKQPNKPKDKDPDAEFKANRNSWLSF